MTEALPDYLQRWELSNPQPLAETVTSFLYTVTWNGQKAVLKLLRPAGLRDEQKGAAALRWFNGEGAVRLLLCDDRAHLLEYAEGPDLKSLVQDGGDEKATVIIADVLNRLHHSRKGNVPHELTPLMLRFRSLFQKAEQDRDGGVSSVYTAAAELAQQLLASQKDLCVLHGDVHHENVRYSRQRAWLALDPKGLYGERTYDAANVLCNPSGMDEFVANEARLLKTVELLTHALKIDPFRLIQFTFAHCALSACWSLEDSEDPTLALRVAAIAESRESKLIKAR